MSATILPFRAPARALQLTAGQQAAVALVEAAAAAGAKDMPVVVVEGYAGTGKSTAVRQLAHLNPLLLAPTGKAALRLRELTGQVTSTIHRWLYAVWEDEDSRLHFSKRETELPNGCKAIVVDEVSMVGEQVWEDLLAEGKYHGVPVVGVGDRAQLPPVAAGAGEDAFSVLKLDAPRASLTEILRQAAGNPVIAASAQIRQGDWIPALKSFPKVAQGQLVREALAVHQAGGATLCHKNRTRAALNRGMRGLLGYEAGQLRASEPLLVLKNNYLADLYNGEVVTFAGWAKEPWQHWFSLLACYVHVGVARIDAVGADGARQLDAWLCQEVVDGQLTGDRARMLAKDFDAVPGDDEVPLPFLQAQYGYALTVHKAQGSQWPEVLVVLEPSVPMHRLEGRQWTYTAVTRAEQGCRINFGSGGLEGFAARELEHAQGRLL